jgi:major membrane immunogen (membrane-anchored lipoprotein)
MKKILFLFVVFLTTFTLIACGDKEEEGRTYAFDGEYLAYEVSVHRDAPMVTWVTVTIEDDEIVEYFIDSRQGSRTQDEETEEYSFAWNELTKKELGDDYGMVDRGGAIAEWDEQAELIEAYWLENGVDSVTVDDDDVIDNVAGVTIKDGGYLALAQEAVDNAKAGKFQSILATGTDLYSAHLTLPESGELEDAELVLDVLQSTTNETEGTFEWNPSTKQELGDAYNMKGAGGYSFEDGEWVSEGQCELEWYEQAALITDYVKANGWNDNLQPVDSRGGSLDGTSLIDELAGVSIRSGSYYTVLDALFDFADPAL